MGGRWDDLFRVVKKCFSHILKNAEHKQDLCHTEINNKYFRWNNEGLYKENSCKKASWPYNRKCLQYLSPVCPADKWHKLKGGIKWKCLSICLVFYFSSIPRCLVKTFQIFLTFLQTRSGTTDIYSRPQSMPWLADIMMTQKHGCCYNLKYRH